ncbi:MAG: hypothetical protein HY597_03360 [Candidatus Omnitrophica bacterium]|nr:hypothetical protein [Candidatus Omnitrophota bacterium]
MTRGQTLLELILVTLLLTVVGASAVSIEILRLNLTGPAPRQAEFGSALNYAIAHVSRTVEMGDQSTILTDGLGAPSTLQVRQLVNVGANGIADPADFDVPANFIIRQYQRVNAALAADPNGSNLLYDPDINSAGPTEVVLGPQSGTQSSAAMTLLTFSAPGSPNRNRIVVNLRAQDPQTGEEKRFVTVAQLRARSGQ